MSQNRKDGTCGSDLKVKAGGRFGRQSPWRRFGRRLQGKCSEGCDFRYMHTVALCSQDSSCQTAGFRTHVWGPTLTVSDLQSLEQGLRISLSHQALLVQSGELLSQKVEEFEESRKPTLTLQDESCCSVQGDWRRRWREEQSFLGLISKHLVPGPKACVCTAFHTCCSSCLWPIYILYRKNRDYKSAQLLELALHTADLNPGQSRRMDKNIQWQEAPNTN